MPRRSKLCSLETQLSVLEVTTIHEAKHACNPPRGFRDNDSNEESDPLRNPASVVGRDELILNRVVQVPGAV